eukprot:7644583-Pyramimonas_sp.AAC.1
MPPVWQPMGTGRGSAASPSAAAFFPHLTMAWCKRAGDVGLSLLCIQQLAMIAETFSFAEQLAGLAFQPASCVAAPLRAPFLPEVQNQTR